MQRLGAAQLVDVWERGLPLDPVSRALAVLATAWPQLPSEELATLSLGERDARLLEVRLRQFGPGIEAQAICPQCGERLEYALNTTDLRALAAPPEPAYELVTGDLTLRVRRLNSTDLLALLTPDVAHARRALARRTLLSASVRGEPVAVQALAAEALSEPVLTAIAGRLAEADPLAEVLLAMTCPGCGSTWQESFDIASHLWAEIAAAARRLLWEVHVLATAYGWSEAAILTLSDARRQYYLELVEA